MFRMQSWYFYHLLPLLISLLYVAGPEIRIGHSQNDPKTNSPMQCPIPKTLVSHWLWAPGVFVRGQVLSWFFFCSLCGLLTLQAILKIYVSLCEFYLKAADLKFLPFYPAGGGAVGPGVPGWPWASLFVGSHRGVVWNWFWVLDARDGLRAVGMVCWCHGCGCWDWGPLRSGAGLPWNESYLGETSVGRFWSAKFCLLNDLISFSLCPCYGGEYLNISNFCES